MSNLEEFKKTFESGAPPYNATPERVATMHRASEFESLAADVLRGVDGLEGRLSPVHAATDVTGFRIVEPVYEELIEAFSWPC
jgi:hypothetical protein